MRWCDLKPGDMVLWRDETCTIIWISELMSYEPEHINIEHEPENHINGCRDIMWLMENSRIFVEERRPMWTQEIKPGAAVPIPFDSPPAALESAQSA